MGKSGRAGKSVVEKEREKEEEKEGEKEEEKEGKKEEKEPPPPPSDGLDKTPPNVPKVKLMPMPKDKEGSFNGKNGVPSAGDQGKANNKIYLPKDIRVWRKRLYKREKEKKMRRLKLEGRLS